MRLFLNVQATDADRREVKQVKVGSLNKIVDVQWLVWRSPIRPPVPGD